ILTRRNLQILTRRNSLNLLKFIPLISLQQSSWYLIVNLKVILKICIQIWQLQLFSERTFSVMNTIKSRLRNRMGDELLNDCLVTYVEKDVFNCIENEQIIQRYQNMRPHREQ
ncbi:hypothetical protein Tsubulata_013409, partial [Turnera subulata]